MKSKIVDRGAGAETAIRSDRSARAFVWSVWLVMLFVALVFLVEYGRNIPLSEDWFLVPPLTGNEPSLVNWLWSQNNEHRIPFPRLILLALLKVTHGDFRVGMLFNVVVLGVLASAMICVARHVRGGRTRFADAFFPIALLHLGNWENLFWSWQLTQVVPMVLACVILLVLVGRRTVAAPSAEIVAGIALVLLPLSGANGLVFVPILALWLGYCGILHWRAVETRGGRRWIGEFLIGSAVIALGLTGLYFVGYERPSWQPSNPGLGASLKAALQFVALGFGPVARSSWTLSMAAAVGALVPSAIVAVLGVLGHKGPERHRAWGVLLFFGNVVAFALAMGWGRAAVIPLYRTWPIRYVLFAVPAFCTAFFVWELYGSTKLRSIFQNGLLLGMCLLLPFNTVHGLWWRDQYRAGAESLEQDLIAGIPCSTLAERQRDFLLHWMEPSYLADLMRMLREAGIGPFAQMREDPVKTEDAVLGVTPTRAQSLVTLEIRYHMPDAGEGFLVWGVNGWQLVPREIRPVGTVVKDGVMHTPMIQEGETLVARVQAPAGVTIDYGFLITKEWGGTDVIKPVWDGDQNYQVIVSNDDVVEVEAMLALAPDQTPVSLVDTPLLTQEIRYHMPQAGEVYLVWGIEGWHAVAEAIRTSGTVVKDAVMHTPMAQEGDTFAVKVQAPAGVTLDYGFLITKKRGIFDVIMPVWDSNQNYQMIVSKDGVVEVTTTLTLANELSDILENRLYFLVGVGVFLVTWLSIFFFLGLFGGSKKDLMSSAPEIFGVNSEG
jgi:hypothetical protein